MWSANSGTISPEGLDEISTRELSLATECPNCGHACYDDGPFAFDPAKVGYLVTVDWQCPHCDVCWQEHGVLAITVVVE